MIRLEGVLLRPALSVFTQGFQNYQEQQFKDDKQIITLDFHVIYVNNKKTLSLYIANLTSVIAAVRVAHVKKKPNNINANLKTITHLEKEELNTTDDP